MYLNNAVPWLTAKMSILLLITKWNFFKPTVVNNSTVKE